MLYEVITSIERAGECPVFDQRGAFRFHLIGQVDFTGSVDGTGDGTALRRGKQAAAHRAILLGDLSLQFPGAFDSVSSGSI